VNSPDSQRIGRILDPFWCRIFLLFRQPKRTASLITMARWIRPNRRKLRGVGAAFGRILACLGLRNQYPQLGAHGSFTVPGVELRIAGEQIAFVDRPAVYGTLGFLIAP